jgi:hypothetical protein
MGGAVPPLPQYAFMAWCSVRGSTGNLHLFTFTVPQPVGRVAHLTIVYKMYKHQWDLVQPSVIAKSAAAYLLHCCSLYLLYTTRFQINNFNFNLLFLSLLSLEL